MVASHYCRLIQHVMIISWRQWKVFVLQSFSGTCKSHHSSSVYWRPRPPQRRKQFCKQIGLLRLSSLLFICFISFHSHSIWLFDFISPPFIRIKSVVNVICMSEWHQPLCARVILYNQITNIERKAHGPNDFYHCKFLVWWLITIVLALFLSTVFASCVMAVFSASF